MKIRGLWVLVCLPLPVLIASAGCNEELDESDMDAAEEAVGEAQQAVGLGDLDCASSASKDYVSYTPSTCDIVDGDLCSYTTGTNNYGDDWTSGEACQEYLVVEAHSDNYPAGESMLVRGQAICVFGGGELPAPTNQADCENLHLELALYNFDENGDHYELSGTDTNTGTWTGSSCSLPAAEVHDQLNCTSSFTCEHSPIAAGRCYRDNPPFGIPFIYRVYVGLDRI